MDNGAKCERKPVLFEDVINRLDRLVGRQIELTGRAYQKSTRIANTDRPFDCSEDSEKNQNSIIGILQAIMDKLDRSGDVLEAVVDDLENSIM